MEKKENQQARVRSLLTEAVTLLCRTGLRYSTGFTVEGLLGITVDNSDIFLVNIREAVAASVTVPMSCVVMTPASTSSFIKSYVAETAPLEESVNVTTISDTFVKHSSEQQSSDFMVTEIIPATSTTEFLPCVSIASSSLDNKDKDLLLSYGSCFKSHDFAPQHQRTSETISAVSDTTVSLEKSENSSDDIILMAATDSSESDQGGASPAEIATHPVSSRKRRANADDGIRGGKLKSWKPRKMSCGITRKVHNFNDNSLNLTGVGESEMPVIVGMGDLPGINDLSSMTGMMCAEQLCDMSEMASTYFDDVVVEVSHDGTALFTNVELDDIISKAASQSKFTSAELDEIMTGGGNKVTCQSKLCSREESQSDMSKRKKHRLLPVSDSDESDDTSPNFVSQSSETSPPNYCSQLEETCTNYCSGRSADVLLSGVVTGGDDGQPDVDSPSIWDPATDDSLGGGEMAPLNLAGPQDLSTGIGKKRHTCQLCGKRCRTETMLKKHRCRSDKDMPEPLNLIRQPLDLTIGRLDDSDSSAYIYADLLTSTTDLLSSGGEALLGSGEGTATMGSADGFACICSRSYTDYDEYVRHAGACSKARLTPYKSCDICGKFFFSNSGFAKHKKQHVGTYKFTCTVCHKGFFDRTHLHAHNDSSHSKVRRYACLRCDKSFFWKHHLKRHGDKCTATSPASAAAGEAIHALGDEEEEHKVQGEEEGKVEDVVKGVRFMKSWGRAPSRTGNEEQGGEAVWVELNEDIAQCGEKEVCDVVGSTQRGLSWKELGGLAERVELGAMEEEVVVCTNEGVGGDGTHWSGVFRKGKTLAEDHLRSGTAETDVTCMATWTNEEKITNFLDTSSKASELESFSLPSIDRTDFHNTTTVPTGGNHFAHMTQDQLTGQLCQWTVDNSAFARTVFAEQCPDTSKTLKQSLCDGADNYSLAVEQHDSHSGRTTEELQGHGCDNSAASSESLPVIDDKTLGGSVRTMSQ